MATTAAPAHLAHRSDIPGLVRPLTTIWTPPADCPAIVQSQPTVKPEDAAVAHRCAPPDFQAVWQHGGEYSPGVCISGYTIATTYGPGSTLNYWVVEPSETAAICVPSGYTAWPKSEDYISWAGIAVSAQSAGRTYTWSSRVPAFHIRWKASDLPVLAAATTMPLPTGATTGSGSGDSNRMSTGVIAGIAVGGVAIVTLAVATLLFILRHRRRRLSPIYVETAEDLSEKTDGLVGSGAGAVAAAPQETTWQPGRPASAPLQARPVESPIPPVAAATELPGEVHPNRGIPPMAASPDPTSNPTSYRGQSPTPAVGDEIAQLMEKKARVDERRKRLLELEQLDSEADAIDQRLVLLRRQGGG